MKVHDIREAFKAKLASEDFVIDKTGSKMLEMVGASFTADEPSIFGTVNQDYVERELAWYMSMSLNVNDIPGGPPAIWKQVADKNGYINSNYGWCIFSKDNNFQFNNVVNELREHPNSRRAVMIYTNPRMWYKYNENGRSDFMCTNVVQYMIRKGELHAVVQMRSNDVVFGYKNDYAWQSYVLDKLSDELEVKRGSITWQVGSLHVYERHFHLVV